MHISSFFVFHFSTTCTFHPSSHFISQPHSQPHTNFIHMHISSIFSFRFPTTCTFHPSSHFIIQPQAHFIIQPQAHFINVLISFLKHIRYPIVLHVFDSISCLMKSDRKSPATLVQGLPSVESPGTWPATACKRVEPSSSAKVRMALL